MSRTLSAPRWGLSAAVAGATRPGLDGARGGWPGYPGERRVHHGQMRRGRHHRPRRLLRPRRAHTCSSSTSSTIYCIGTPGFGPINVTYEALGSGAGRDSMKVRNDTPRFGMTDEPPTPTEIAQMNTGTRWQSGRETTPIPTTTARSTSIPAAVGAVAPLVNFPDGCDVDLLPDAASNTAAAGSRRRRDRRRPGPGALHQGAVRGDLGAEDAGVPRQMGRSVFPSSLGDADCEQADHPRRPLRRVRHQSSRSRTT